MVVVVQSFELSKYKVEKTAVAAVVVVVERGDRSNS